MVLTYTRNDAKDWAAQHMKGVCNVTIPTFSADRTRLNSQAIVHDLNLAKEKGFWGTLLVSEGGTTVDEMTQFMEIATEARPPGFRLVLHGSFDHADDLIRACNAGVDLGVDAVLLSYPPDFRPTDPQQIVDFTTNIAERTDLGLILFAASSWGFRSLDPTGFPMGALEEICALDTAIALKYECGHPGIAAAMVEAQKRCGDKVVISDPMEFNAPAWVEMFGMQWLGTSGYEYFGDRVPQWFNLLTCGQFEKGMESYWSCQPAREARGGLHASLAGAKLIHRPAWKYMGWLSGFNGGPLRMPQMRLSPAQMTALRRGLEASGIPVTDDADEAYYAGRNPA